MAIILDGYAIAQNEEKLKRFHESIKVFQLIWTKYDPKATGFINIKDLPNLIMDLLVEEFKELENNVVTGTCCRRKV